jgi:hypothetical protein
VLNQLPVQNRGLAANLEQLFLKHRDQFLEVPFR